MIGAASPALHLRAVALVPAVAQKTAAEARVAGVVATATAANAAATSSPTSAAATTATVGDATGGESTSEWGAGGHLGAHLRHIVGVVRQEGVVGLATDKLADLGVCLG